MPVEPGHHTVHAELRREGHWHGRKRVARLMRGAGLQGHARSAGARPRSRTGPLRPAPTASAVTSPPTRPQSILAGWRDYLDLDLEGWLYLATVIDIASRRVVGYAIADHLRTQFIASALDNAVAARDPEPGVIFRSDRGCQYNLRRVRRPGDDCQVTLSLGRTGQYWDNALAESFFATIKGELIDLRPCPILGSSRPGDRRVHRLVQRHTAAQHPGLPLPAEYEASAPNEIAGKAA